MNHVLGKDSTGKRRQRSKSFSTRREAVAFVNAQQAAIDSGTAVEPSKLTVAELMRLWLDALDVRVTTREGYERLTRNHIVPRVGAVLVQQLAPATLQAMYNAMRTEGVGARTIQLCHMRLTQALAMAVEQDLVQRNPATRVKRPRADTKDMKVWSAEQARQFLAVAAVECPYGPLWLLALATGLRRGELLGLRWQDVDIDGGALTVRQILNETEAGLTFGPPKTRASQRVVLLYPDVVAALRNHKAQQHAEGVSPKLVFTGKTGGAVFPNNLQRHYERLVQLAGVPRINIHGLRHTYATLALSSGAPIKAVSETMGHVRASITLDVYTHALAGQHAEVASKVGGLLLRADALT